MHASEALLPPHSFTHSTYPQAITTVVSELFIIFLPLFPVLSLSICTYYHHISVDITFAVRIPPSTSSLTTMLFIKQALVFTTLLSSTFAAPHHNDDSIVDWNRLNSILDSIDSNVLHNVLHSFTPKFRDGVFSKDRAAIEHVHSHNPILASKIVYIAKRQNSNETTTAQSATTGAGVITSNSPSSTSIASVAPAVSSAVESQITETKSTPKPTTIEIAPSTAPGEVAVSTVPGGVVFSTEGGGVVTKTSSAVTVRFTRSTSTHLYYSTAPDGTITTSTAVVVVNAPVTETAVPTGAQGAAATSGSAGLQNSAERPNTNNFFVGLVLGAAGLYLGL